MKERLSYSRHATVCAVALTVITLGTRASAQESATPSPAPAPTSPIALVIDLPPDTTLDADRLRASIARELGVSLTLQRDAPGGTLVVRQEGARVVVSFDRPDGKHDGRAIPLEADPAQTERDIAIVAVNVARDQVAQFVPSRPPPVREAPRPSPCDASGPFLPVGVDFLPFLGVSTADRGRSIRGLSLGALGDLSGGVHGLALSGVVSVAAGGLCGAQLAGVANIAQDSSGVQIAGVANTASNLDGLEIAGVANVARGDASGAQIGPVNVASGSMHGVQIGVLNYGRDADFQFGVLNINPGGRFLIDAWSKPESALVMAGIKHGGAHYHYVYGIGTRVTDASHPWAAFGVGAHITPTDKVYVDLDAVGYLQLVFRGVEPSDLYETRAVVGYQILPAVSLFAGPTYTVGAQRTSVDIGAPGYASVFSTRSDVTFSGWPGIAVGVEGL